MTNNYHNGGEIFCRQEAQYVRKNILSQVIFSRRNISLSKGTIGDKKQISSPGKNSRQPLVGKYFLSPIAFVMKNMQSEAIFICLQRPNFL